MSSILFSPNAADALNKKVKEKIDKRLFLFCNYNPDSLRTYSYDAKFFLGIMNLYKLLIDTGICKKFGKIKKKYSLSFDCNRLNYIILIIESFRTYLSHNVDCKSANEDDKVNVERWFLQLIGRKYPENAEQYEKPLEEITKYGEECIKLLNVFVEEVSMHTRKNEIIAEWVNLIFNFYSRPNSKNIIKGHIKLTYLALKGTSTEINEYDIALWTKKMLCYPEQTVIDNLEYALTNVSCLSEKNKKDISEKIKETSALMDNNKKKIAEHQKKNKSELKPFDYLDYYVCCFPKQIRKKYEDGTLESLLPQDVVDQIIEDDYSGVTP